jgi:DNA-binding IscR family transcriptional regulator
LKSARDAFLEVLDGYTLNDLIQPAGRLTGLLGISQVNGVTSAERLP